MGRKSHADQIIEEFKDAPEDGGEFLVIYDFEGGNPTRFYQNLDKILNQFGGEPIQLSVIRSPTRRCALAVKTLAQIYGAKVQIFPIKKE